MSEKEVKTEEVQNVVEETVGEEQAVDYAKEYQNAVAAYNELAAKFNKLLAAYNTLFDNYLSSK